MACATCMQIRSGIVRIVRILTTKGPKQTPVSNIRVSK